MSHVVKQKYIHGWILNLIFSKTPSICVNTLRQARSQNQNLAFERAETKTNKSSFCRKMRHEVTLKSEILSQLDFKSAAQDVVFNCLDGQVCLRCVWVWDLLLLIDTGWISHQIICRWKPMLCSWQSSLHSSNNYCRWPHSWISTCSPLFTVYTQIKRPSRAIFWALIVCTLSTLYLGDQP